MTSLADIARRFERTAKAHQKLARQAERSLRRGSLRERQADAILCGSFLAVFSSFESAMEDILVSCILGRAGINTGSPKFHFASASSLNELLVRVGSGPGWMSWSKFKDLDDLAAAFLRGRSPFARLRRRPREVNLVALARAIRNHIAHRSRNSRAKLASLLPAKSNLAAAAVLRSSSGTTMRYEELVAGLIGICKAVTAPKDLAAEKFLHAESPFSSGEAVRRGKYECCKCGHPQQVTQKTSKLSPCSNCVKACVQCGKHDHKSQFRRSI